MVGTFGGTGAHVLPETPQRDRQVACSTHPSGGWCEGYSEQSAPSISKDKKLTTS